MTRTKRAGKSARKKSDFKPEISRVILEPEQAVLACCGKQQLSQVGAGGSCCPRPTYGFCLPRSSAGKT